MYRQLLVTILLTSLLALLASVVVSAVSTRTYLVEQLRVKNQDNASALALSLSQISEDKVKVELAVAAQFDSGNYKLVSYLDPHGNKIIEKQSDDLASGVPAWFVKLLPIDVPSGNAKVSKGWSQLGTVILESHRAYAYRSLWKSAIQMSISMTIAALISVLLGAMILRRIKKPLDSVVKQAEAISQKQFISIPEPRVPELQSLARAMNLTVQRLKQIFEDEAKRLEQVRRQANYDSVTDLPNRGFFMTQLKEALHTEETAFGSFLMLRVADLNGVNKRNGRQAADNMIKSIANVLKKYSDNMDNSQLARLNGSDFAILIPADNALEVANKMLAEIVAAIQQYYDTTHYISAGMAEYHKGIAMPELLSRVDMALINSEAESKNSIIVAEKDQSIKTPNNLEDWSKLIKDAIQFARIYLLSFPVGDLKGGILHREGPLRIRESDNSEWIPAGKFLPVAERLGLNSVLDLAAVKIGLEKISQDKSLIGFAINLSATSLKDSSFIPSLLELLQANKSNAKKLWLELPETGVYKHFSEFKLLCNSLKGTGVKIGIEHFGQNFEQVSLLHDLGVNYLKVDASFIRGIESNPGNQSFLKGLTSIAHSIGVLVIAEGVLTEQEVEMLRNLDFDGATGPAVKEI
jgi:diguanylate cyclase (GGDEF)-like protein